MSSEQEEYSIAHTERWILSPKAPGAGSKEPAIDAHCKAQQCSIPLSSAHYLPILIQCPILANTTQQCPILACTLTIAGTIRRWQSKRHWALGKSECSDLPEAKINTPAPLYVQLQYPPSPPCATSILQPPLHVQLQPVGNPVHTIISSVRTLYWLAGKRKSQTLNFWSYILHFLLKHLKLHIFRERQIFTDNSFFA